MKRCPGFGVIAFCAVLVMGLSGTGGEPLSAPTAENKEKMTFQAADTNADGNITREELTQGMIKTAFARLDANGDQVITREEWVALDREPGAGERFDAMDKNRDEKVTFFEFSKSARESLNVSETFIALDRNENGSLSPDEYSGRPHFKILSVRF